MFFVTFSNHNSTCNNNDFYFAEVLSKRSKKGALMNQVQFNEQPNSDMVKNPVSFATQVSNTKSPIQLTISQLVREVRKNKWTYETLKGIFQQVRTRCSISSASKIKKQIILPTKEELDRFFKSSNSANPIHGLIFKTLEMTGLRVFELVNLEIADIDWENNQFIVKNGKGGKARQAVLPPTLKQHLLIYLSGRNLRYLFESKNHTKYSTRRIQQLCEHYRKQASTPKIHVHLFRHLYASRLAAGNMSVDKRMTLCGHASREMQQHYSTLVLQDVKNEAISILEKHF